ncbi:methylcrotonyl-CoA carboxylase subunit alpha [Oceanisphaera marina]|uniref:Methylcrotonyl-CoA carboxylase subunit alpha n=1 Tax=Oceanisphaera marina TaxID=2017550 RepID=A0ABQ1IWA3_9GAMM|nr:biotin carboxylase N-terminal domain-containing protein [Oceanisphaera marina]GGB53984.1 methylcrotonyl-CoA carboxylase subunit alpha [Oceanisphaera marina]
MPDATAARLFNKILIANRGEIACRIIRTCRQLGIATLAVYSAADADAIHVAEADEAWYLGPAPATDSYLRQDRLLEIAKASGAEAIHPGYGFLSENADFARACTEQGIVFIGPPAAAISAMGSKSAAKTLMSAAGVPVVPGFHEDLQDPVLLRQAAERCGFPLLLKAVAGGGGKGMRLVEQLSEFDEALAAAKREARAAFGDDAMLLERYLPQARHIEVQIFCDMFGQGIYLGQRDCSLQRRQQKVIEEAPAPDLPHDIAIAMGEAAVRAALAIDYCGAGTVEFLYLDDGQFFFMEMNTRLQVEHPVTELITGLDLVDWQLRIAAGQPLPLSQSQVTIQGHAIEVRVYAEDPARQFLPAAGHLHYLHEPPTTPSTYGPVIRLDTGVRQGDCIGIYYDPLIAKLIVWAPTRSGALRHLARALAEYRIGGVRTNVGFLTRLVALPALHNAELHTRFIAEHEAELSAPAALSCSQQLALAAAFLLLSERTTQKNADCSPFADHQGWWLNLPARRMVELVQEEKTHRLTVSPQTDGWQMQLDDAQHTLTATLTEDQLDAVLDQRPLRCYLARHQDQLWLFYQGERFDIQLARPQFSSSAHAAADSLQAPMPGVISQLKVAVGDTIEAGQTLLIMEAMKMEHAIRAPTAGRVAELYYRQGSQVAEGSELLRIEADS